MTSRADASNDLTAIWDAYPIDKYSRLQTNGNASRGGRPGGVARPYTFHDPSAMRPSSTCIPHTHMVPIAVGYFRRRGPTEEAEGDGEPDGSNGVTRDSEEDVGKVDRHGDGKLFSCSRGIYGGRDRMTSCASTASWVREARQHQTSSSISPARAVTKHG